ncbi:MAG: hypothetical protein WDZ51_02990 [Pirellulaceae bacterium]
MKIIGDSSQFAPLFPDDFLKEILERVFMAWDNIPKPIDETKETRITKLLRKHYAYDKVIKKLPFRVAREFTIDSEFGEELGRIDLCLLHGDNEDVYFAFECKRLNVLFPNGEFKSLASEYTGVDGIECFICEKYSRSHRHAGMIAYVLDGNRKDALKSVANRLVKQSEKICLSSGGFHPPTHVQHEWLRKTLHSLSGRTMSIHHLFLSSRDENCSGDERV